MVRMRRDLLAKYLGHVLLTRLPRVAFTQVLYVQRTRQSCENTAHVCTTFQRKTRAQRNGNGHWIERPARTYSALFAPHLKVVRCGRFNGVPEILSFFRLAFSSVVFPLSGWASDVSLIVYAIVANEFSFKMVPVIQSWVCSECDPSEYPRVLRNI